MRFDKGKLFFDKEEIRCIPYDESAVDYYAFLKEARTKGYRQVIVTSEVMLDFIMFIYSEKRQKTYKIELMEEDDELETEIKELLRKVDDNPYSISLLIEKLRFLAEKSSIDIKRVYIKGIYQDGAENYFIQSNGIIGVDETHYASVTNEISVFIKRCLQG